MRSSVHRTPIFAGFALLALVGACASSHAGATEDPPAGPKNPDLAILPIAPGDIDSGRPLEGTGVRAEADASAPSAAAPTCAEWKNPELPADLPNLGGDPDLQKVPEGLTLVDATGAPTTHLECGSPSVVFVHGWSPTGSATDFPSPAMWRKGRFNTFVFRWHRRSYDTELIPFMAESRIPAVADELLGKLGELRTALGPAHHELRLVGHSLGGHLVAETAFKAIDPAGPGNAPDRIELLDPAYILEMPGNDGLTALGNKLEALRGKGIKIVVYSSVVADIFGLGTTWNAVNLQIMAADWTGSLDLVMKHTEIVPYYFDSLVEKEPPVKDSMRGGFSASVPTDQIPSEAAIHLLQIAGDMTVTIKDDEYVGVP